jgi:LmbE family N-acetylglucosaminyl deacetylase
MNEFTRREALLAVAATTIAAAPKSEEKKVAAAKKLKIIIAGGHPDDPESACGGTAAKLAAAGHDVVNFYLTRGEAGTIGKSHEEAAAIRSAEAEAACKILGVRALFANQIDGATEINGALYAEVKEIIEKESPGIVITHWPIDTHRDHRAMSYLIYDAWLRMAKNFELYYFEVESGHQTQHFHPTHYIDISEFEAKKREACYCHKSQNPDGFYGLHTTMHQFRGHEAGCTFAEAFVRHSQNKSVVVIGQV